MFPNMFNETKNSVKKLLVLLAAVTAFGAVEQAWGMEEKLAGKIESIYFIAIEKNDPNDKTYAMYKMETKDLPAAILPAIISNAYHNKYFIEASSVMISYPMSSDCLVKINNLLKERKLQACKKICSFSKSGNNDIKVSETSEINTEEVPDLINTYMANNSSAEKFSKKDWQYVYLMNDNFYRKTIIEPLTDDVNLPIFGVAKNGKIYRYNGEDANKRLNFRKKKFSNFAYFIIGFIDNNNETVGPDFTCVGEVTANIQDKATFTQDGNFKEKLDAKFDNIFFKKLDEQHKRGIMNIDVYLISKDAEKKSITLHRLAGVIPIPVKIALLKNAALINHLIVPFEDNGTRNLGSFCVSTAVNEETFKSISETFVASYHEGICSLKGDKFTIPKKSTHVLSWGKKVDNYDCMNEVGLKKLLQEALASNENNDAYCQENIINPLKRQGKPLLALNDKNKLYLYTKENNANNYFEKLKLIMQEKFIKISGEGDEEKGFFPMKERINAQDNRFKLIGKIKENSVEWDGGFKETKDFAEVDESKLLEELKIIETAEPLAQTKKEIPSQLSSADPTKKFALSLKKLAEGVE